MHKPSAWGNFKHLYGNFDDKQRRKYLWLIVLGFINIILDLIGLVMLYATTMSLLNESFVAKIRSLTSSWSVTYSLDAPLVLYLSGALAVLFFAKSILSYINSKYQIELAYAITEISSERQFDSFLRRGMHENKDEKAVDKIHQLYSVQQSLAEHIIVPSITMITELGFLFMALTVVAFVELKLLLLLSITVLPMAIMLTLFNRKKVSEYGKQISVITPKMYQTISDSVFGYVMIRLHNRGNYFKNKFGLGRKKIFAYRIKSFLRTSAASVRIMESVTVLSLFVIAFYAYKSGQQEQMTSMLALFASLSFRALPSINRILGAHGTFMGMSYILEMMPKIEKESKFGLSINEEFKFSEAIELKEVFYEYDQDTPIINQLNLTIKKATMVGIYGGSGTGKSTLLNLILGFYSPRSGSIMIDGNPISENLEGWQRKLAYVEQDSHMVAGSIIENVAFGEEQPNLDRISEVLAICSLNPWIQSLSNGIGTLIGERGTRISGGQRQRLALARALYSKAEVIILDEATNSLDPETQHDILETISNLKAQGFTIILVSHDQNVFKHCDVIYELKNGSLHAHSN